MRLPLEGPVELRRQPLCYLKTLKPSPTATVPQLNTFADYPWSHANRWLLRRRPSTRPNLRRQILTALPPRTMRTPARPLARHGLRRAMRRFWGMQTGWSSRAAPTSPTGEFLASVANLCVPFPLSLPIDPADLPSVLPSFDGRSVGFGTSLRQLRLRHASPHADLLPSRRLPL